jgi:phosphopantetheinyl transferase (holo-ACP synthase)
MIHSATNSAMTRIVAMPLPDSAGIALADACLAPAERLLMAQYRHPRRRAEFVAGRLSLKRALLESQDNSLRICGAGLRRDLVLPAAAQGIAILPDDAGRPCIDIDNSVAGAIRPTSVSISHAAGWVAAACADRPIGLDIVDGEAATGLSGEHAWLADCPPDWRVRSSALLWGLHECLLKSGALPARTLWALQDIDAAPLRAVSAVVADWPATGRLASLEISVGERIFAGAFVPLSATVLLVMVLLPILQALPGKQVQENQGEPESSGSQINKISHRTFS